MNLKPLPGHVLVELREKYEHVAVTEQKYDTKTSGICVAVGYVPREIANDVVELEPYLPIPGKRVFWEEYKDGAVIERDGKKYAFIKIEDLDGYEDDETNA